MSNTPTPLTPAERAEIAAPLAGIRDRLERAGELLPAVHVAHALHCLPLSGPAPE